MFKTVLLYSSIIFAADIALTSEIELSLTNPGQGEWKVFAEIYDNTINDPACQAISGCEAIGIASFELNMVSSPGLRFLTAQNTSPASFSLFRNDGDVFDHFIDNIHAAQPTVFADPSLIEEHGHLSPFEIASGTFEGRGNIVAFANTDIGAGLRTSFNVLYGDRGRMWTGLISSPTIGGGDVENANFVEPGVSITLASVPEPSSWIPFVIGICILLLTSSIILRSRE